MFVNSLEVFFTNKMSKDVYYVIDKAQRNTRDIITYGISGITKD